MSSPANPGKQNKNLLAGAIPEVRHANQLPPGNFEAHEELWKIIPPPRTPEGRNSLRVAFRVPIPLDPAVPLVFECSARAVADHSQTGSGTTGQAGLVLELALREQESDKSHAIFRQILLVGPEWENFRIPLEPDQSAAGGAWELALAPSHFSQPVELRAVCLRAPESGETLSPAVAYPGQSADDAWREVARERIARHRMGDLRVRVTDHLGNPLQGLRIHLRQKRHAYRFGTCVNACRLTDAEIQFSDPAMTRERFVADNARYRKELTRLFNYVVLENDLKWTFWPEGNRIYRQTYTLRALEWLRDHRIPAKGHTLMWASWSMTPQWLRELADNPQVLQKAILTHIRDICDATADLTVAWDVLNEPMSHRDIIELLGQSAVAEWFRTARVCLPNHRLVLNEFDLVGNGGSPARRESIYALLADLRAAGAAPDVLSCQAHFWSDRLTAPQDIWHIVDEMHSRTGLPIAVSEFDMNFPNDRVQADYTRDFLTAWFAHPATESFIMWGFWGGAHWFGERGAMFRKDWSRKPNLDAYEELLFHEWWTDTTCRTDSDGTAQFRGFQGDYEVEIERPGKSLPLLRLTAIRHNPRTISVVIPPDAPSHS